MLSFFFSLCHVCYVCCPQSEMNNAGEAAARAYKSVFDILRTISRSESPFEKIRCVLNALQEINARVQCFFNARSQTKAVAMFVHPTPFPLFMPITCVFLCSLQWSGRPGVDCPVLPGQVGAEERGERVAHDGGLHDVVHGAQPGRLLCCHVLCLCCCSPGTCHLKDLFVSLLLLLLCCFSFPVSSSSICGERERKNRKTHA